jgi:hypothetical protein
MLHRGLTESNQTDLDIEPSSCSDTTCQIIKDLGESYHASSYLERHCCKYFECDE